MLLRATRGRVVRVPRGAGLLHTLTAVRSRYTYSLDSIVGCRALVACLACCCSARAALCTSVFCRAVCCAALGLGHGLGFMRIAVLGFSVVVWLVS
jgi:hypothetical protein